MLPGTDQSRETGNCAHGLTATGVALHGDADAHHRRRRGGVFPCQLDDVLNRNAGLLGGELGGVGRRPLRQFVVADGVLVDVVAVDQVLLDDDVNHRQRQRRIGARADRNMPVGKPCGARPHRIDHHQLRAGLLGLLDERPVVRVGAERVARPQENIFRVHEAFGIDPGRRTDRHHVGRARARVAKGPFRHGGAELVEQGVTDVQPVDDALGAEVAVGQDRLCAICCDD
jgi:hypothetical protein